MSEKNTKALQHELAYLRSEVKKFNWKQRQIQAQLVTDPEKNRKLYKLSETTYLS